MKLANKIVTIFLGNHLPQYKVWMESKSEKFPSSETFFVYRAFEMAGSLGIDPRQVIDFESLHKFYDTESEYPRMDKTTIDEAMKRCDNEAIEAIDLSSMLTSDKNKMIISMSKIKDQKIISLLIQLIKLRADRYLGHSTLMTMASHYENYGRTVGEKESEYLLASFILDNQTLVAAWLDKLRAVNPEEKRKLIMSWCEKRVDEKRVLEELFCGSSDKFKAVEKAA